MKTPLFLAACVLLGLAAWAAGLRFMDEVEPGWWPLAVTLVGGATILGRLWVARAASQSPMRFVSSVNGASAIKMFSMLINSVLMEICRHVLSEIEFDEHFWEKGWTQKSFAMGIHR